jgi:hypothetical protein
MYEFGQKPPQMYELLFLPRKHLKCMDFSPKKAGAAAKADC